MAVKYIPIIYTFIFAVIMFVTVPRTEIRRLSIHGIIFGAVIDVVLVTIANAIGAFRYINYEPFGMIGIHFFAPISWAIFFVLYFYFLPEKKIYIWIYTAAGIFYSTFFCQTITKLGVLKLSHGLIDSIAPFVLWFP
jgi:hypothetical protein